MVGLRAGIDVGGTFTHGVVLRPPGEILAKAKVPTTHTHEYGVAAGVKEVLRQLIEAVGVAEIELVAHSTTQATNALLEGDVSPVERWVIEPPGEGLAARLALNDNSLSLGGSRAIKVTNRFVAHDAVSGGQIHIETMSQQDAPLAVIQPLAGSAEVLEQQLAKQLAGTGRKVVCASDITKVLGLAARARTVTVNASMLPAMLATAEFTRQAVDKLLPGVPVQVVRSDGGAMSLSEMQAMPVLSLLSGPAAGASAALHASGLANAVFIEVGGTSTDISLIKDGRVRHRYATVGGQRLMVPALDLRTVAVGGGSMLRSDGARYGPRSAHKAGLQYLFQALADGRQITGTEDWADKDHGGVYLVARMDDGSLSAITLTDSWLLSNRDLESACRSLGASISREQMEAAQSFAGSGATAGAAGAFVPTCRIVSDAVKELLHAQQADKSTFTLVGGGGGAPVILEDVARILNMPPQLIDNNEVISAIGAALAVTCVSLSRSVAEPTAAVVDELISEVEAKLAAQGSERVTTDYEYDPHRQVLTVTGRGNRPYDQGAMELGTAELEAKCKEILGEGAEPWWQSKSAQLWVAAPGQARIREGRHARAQRLGIAIDNSGRTLWHGLFKEMFTAAPAQREAVLAAILEKRTQYTDGGPSLPGLALICAGRFIPLDAMSTREMVEESLRWEKLPQGEPGCYILRT